MKTMNYEKYLRIIRIFDRFFKGELVIFRRGEENYTHNLMIK